MKMNLELKKIISALDRIASILVFVIMVPVSIFWIAIGVFHLGAEKTRRIWKDTIKKGGSDG